MVKGFCLCSARSSFYARPTIVTVIDGHSHSLSWIGSAIGTQCYPLGVNDFGQSGDTNDLYREYGLDAGSISATCYGALGL